MFLAVQLLKLSWERRGLKLVFSIGLASAVTGSLLTIFALFRSSAAAVIEQGETLEPVDPTAAAGPGTSLLTPLASMGILLALAGLGLLAVTLLLSFGRRLRSDFPALDLLIISGTITLPQLAAIPANMLGWDPLVYEDNAAVLRTSVALSGLILVSIGIGLAWGWRRWIVAAAIFLGIFAIFYTTVFTYGFGLFTGFVGSLGYWIEQHGVNRGSQPWYYYLLVQIPIYEYLPAVGSLLAAFYGLRRWWTTGLRPSVQAEPSEAEAGGAPNFPFVLFLGYWTFTSLVAYSFAGERMPWLTVHIALPMILLSGWSIGTFLESIEWSRFREARAWLVVGLSLLALLAAFQAAGQLLGPTPPFAGTQLDQLRVTMNFLTAGAVGLGAATGALIVAREWQVRALTRLSGVLLLGILFMFTVRTSFRAAFVNFDNATEFMVYAHSATGVKTVMEQIEDLSIRTTDGLAIDIGYDDDVSWPFTWYLRNFSKNHYFAASPSRDLQNYPLIVVGDNNWAKVEPILGNRFHSFEYIRMWWPMQDYFDLNADRIWNALRSPEYRGALWDIWLDRDYTAYATLAGRDFSLPNWSPSDRMRLYVRKDIAALIWDYGISPAAFESVEFVDPYEDKLVELAAGTVLGLGGETELFLEQPRSLALAADGSLYVTDTGNHRILRLSPEGELLDTWGQFADVIQDQAPGGTFNEPWGIAVAPDGSVYVADTWNHRIQRFTAEGEFMGMFGFFGQAEAPEAFWGPRDVVVDEAGRVIVSDTGNKRIVVFSADGLPLGSFGGLGLGLGQLDEPVGIAIGADGRMYVADTWNQRIQVFERVGEVSYQAVAEWPIEGWFGQSLENKPYIAVGPEGRVCISDPEGFRVLCFSSEGEFMTGWGTFGDGPTQLGLPVGLEFTQDGGLWIVDSGNNRLLQYNPDLE